VVEFPGLVISQDKAAYGKQGYRNYQDFNFQFSIKRVKNYSFLYAGRVLRFSSETVVAAGRL
jgi:hypothetical protein